MNDTNRQLLLARIRDDLCGGNAAELARKIDKNASYISRLFYPKGKPGGRGIGLEVIDACNEAFKGLLPLNFWESNPQTVELGKQVSLQAEINLNNNPDYPSIRRVKFKLSAGASGFAIDYDGGDIDSAPLVFKRAWFERGGFKPEKLLAISVSGDSMETGLYDGDTVVVDTDDTSLKDGAVFAMNYEGELVIKRLIRDEGNWWLSSDNMNQRKYPRKVCDENVFCIGRIVHKQSERI